jgi:hypothetical protein
MKKYNSLLHLMKTRKALLKLLIFFPGIAIFLSVYLNPLTVYAYDATVRWEAPLKNANGTTLTDLAGYNVYYGRQQRSYDTKIRVSNINTNEYTLTNLSKDITYYCSVTAFDNSGNESSYSDEVSISGYSLTVNKTGTGSGVVTSSPAGITCGTACTNGFDTGSVVTLTATPDGNSEFAGWSGGGCSGTGQCVLVMSAPITVTANFSAIASSSQTIIDNRDASTSKTGTWAVSGGTNPYGQDSFWSRDGATFKWYFTPSTSGLYEISLWWTTYSSRSSSTPLDIQHTNGKARVYVNQRTNGGQWNSIGNFYFNRGTSYDITVISQPYPASTCADAVRFKLVQ